MTEEKLRTAEKTQDELREKLLIAEEKAISAEKAKDEAFDLCIAEHAAKEVCQTSHYCNLFIILRQ